MAGEILTATRQRRISDVAQTALVGSFSQPGVDAIGFKRVKGYFFGSAPAGVGFPVVEFSRDGLVYDISRVIPIDGTQPLNTYPFDLRIEARYVRVEWFAVGPVATVLIQAELEP